MEEAEAKQMALGLGGLLEGFLCPNWTNQEG